jgi:hypothetical protein
MNYFILLSIIYLICKIKYVYSEKSYFRFRNSLLRIYIANNKKDKLGEYTHKIFEKTKSKLEGVHQYTSIKYNNFNVFYNSLTDEERELINFILTLCY